MLWDLSALSWFPSLVLQLIYRFAFYASWTAKASKWPHQSLGHRNEPLIMRKASVFYHLLCPIIVIFSLFYGISMFIFFKMCILKFFVDYIRLIQFKESIRSMWNLFCWSSHYLPSGCSSLVILMIILISIFWFEYIDGLVDSSGSLSWCLHLVLGIHRSVIINGILMISLSIIDSPFIAIIELGSWTAWISADHYSCAVIDDQTQVDSNLSNA